MTPAARWSIAGLVLVVAAIVAIWPREDDPPPAPAADEPAARAAAKLPPCQTGPVGPAELAGLATECLADGSTVDFSRLLTDQPVLVNVWATWCEPCRTELPLLADYADRKDAARVVTVAVQSKPVDALELLAELGVRLPAVLDGDGGVQRALKVPKALPASYLVDDSGVRLVEEPRLFHSVEEIAAAVGR